ncbi:MAG: twin-arginine translocase TatA/TatE family subunit [Candidatus Cloacimonadota bacterium]|nr:twin-arginine translocase TatA/TatE family subunit [candidate division WOR-3 bacterium]TET79275.1 MAG: twin-arginine translocase TatA/TatE family subunit [Candidatus Cloacimonadota bacterium]
MFGHFGWQEILLILLIIIILFGASRIPNIMKAMGKGVKEFKKGINSEDEKELEDKEEKKDK